MPPRLQRPQQPDPPEGQQPDQPDDQQPAPDAAAQAIRAPVAARPVVFARHPAWHNPEALIDYATKEGMTLYQKAVEPITPTFNGSADTLKLFLAQLKFKASANTWMRILTIPVNGHPKNLIDHYGEITKVQLQNHANIYQAAGDRQAQSSSQLFQCLMASLTPELTAKVVNESATYMMMVPDGEGNQVEEGDGPLLLYTIIKLASTSAYATSASIRSKLSALDQHLMTVKDFNLVEFHLYVKDLMNRLATLGETTSDLLANLMKAYRVVKDKPFQNWIGIQRSSWHSGTLTFEPDGEQLMALVEGFYKDAVLANDWMTQTEEEKTILALQAQLKLQTRLRHNKNQNQRAFSKPEWMTTAPKPGESLEKSRDGKTYHWCSEHNSWVLHKASECRLKGKKGVASPNRTNTRISTKELKRQAFQTILELSSDEEPSQSESESEAEGQE